MAGVLWVVLFFVVAWAIDVQESIEARAKKVVMDPKPLENLDQPILIKPLPATPPVAIPIIAADNPHPKESEKEPKVIAAPVVRPSSNAVPPLHTDPGTPISQKPVAGPEDFPEKMKFPEKLKALKLHKAFLLLLGAADALSLMPDWDDVRSAAHLLWVSQEKCRYAGEAYGRDFDWDELNLPPKPNAPLKKEPAEQVTERPRTMPARDVKEVIVQPFVKPAGKPVDEAMEKPVLRPVGKILEKVVERPERDEKLGHPDLSLHSDQEHIAKPRKDWP